MNAVPPAPGATEIIALIQKTCAPLDAEFVPLANALGRVLREPVCATEDLPAFDRSAVDGYAVQIDDDSSVLSLVDEIRAGDWKPRELKPGEATRIATGGALPAPNLRVVMKEDAEISGNTVRVLKRTAERYVRCRGEDALKGQTLVAVSTRLTAGSLALLASLGCAKPCVNRLPRVFHFATGNELVTPEAVPLPGQIRDSNSTLVDAFLQSQGVVARQCRLAEDKTAIEAALGSCAEVADVILVSGGASVGSHDFTRQALEKNGFEVLVSKTATRPGKPLIFARRGPVVAFGLPGNPLAHFVCLNLFVRAALESLAGLPPPPLWRRGSLASALDAGGNARETFWPAFCREDLGEPTLTPLRWSSSGDLTALATANALIRVTDTATSLAPGTAVEFVRT